jgi:hypothetical protein
MVAYFFGEFTNSYVLAKCKVQTQGKRMFLRFVLSTVVGQFFDSVVFVLVAFTGVMSVSGLVSVAATGWVLMVLWEIVALPVTLPIANTLKRREQVDYFDINTNFNPLQFYPLFSRRTHRPLLHRTVRSLASLRFDFLSVMATLHR